MKVARVGTLVFLERLTSVAIMYERTKERSFYFSFFCLLYDLNYLIICTNYSLFFRLTGVSNGERGHFGVLLFIFSVSYTTTYI